MSQTSEAVKNTTPKKKKPLRRAQRWGSEVPRMALKLVSLMAAIIVMGLMFSALQALGTAWLRIALSLTIASGMLLMCYNEGITKGVKDVGASRFYADMQERAITPGAREDAACYHPMKPAAVALCVFAVPMALAAYIAVTTQGYTYALQDLPAWLTQSYGARADVMAPLGAYAQEAALTATDWIRMLVRLPVMIYINLFSDPLVMSGTIDRLAPLFLATFPAVYVTGYLLAPRANRRQQKLNRRAKKVAVRKAQRSSLAQELVGDQHGVHYGHKAQSGTHKKKELV